MLETALICSLICTFWFALFWEDMIFETPGEFMRMNLPSYITKPLFDCLTCMSGVWGIVLSVIFLDHPGPVEVVKFVFCLGGMNTIIHAAINFFMASKECYQNGHHYNP